MLNKSKLFLSFISTMLIAAMLCQDLVWALQLKTQAQIAPTLIFHIQDPHSNPSGQADLAKIIQGLSESEFKSASPSNPILIFSEGGSGDCTLDFLKTSANAQQLRRTAKRFLSEGRLHGEEFLNLTTDLPVKIIGMEDQVLYQANLDTYKEIVSAKKSILPVLDGVVAAIQKIKNKTYPESLLAYEAADPANFTARVGQLLGLARDHRVVGVYPHLQKLSKLTEAEAQVFDAGKTLREFEELESKIYKTLLEPEVYELFRWGREAELYHKAFRIQLSSGEFEDLKKRRQERSFGRLLGLVNRRLAEWGYFESISNDRNAVDQAWSNVEEFYSLTRQRDLAFMETLGRQKFKKAIVIAGGYHSAHLAELFRERGYSYQVMAPKVERESISLRYERNLLSVKTLRAPLLAHDGARLAEFEDKTAQKNGLMELVWLETLAASRPVERLAEKARAGEFDPKDMEQVLKQMKKEPDQIARFLELVAAPPTQTKQQPALVVPDTGESSSKKGELSDSVDGDRSKKKSNWEKIESAMRQALMEILVKSSLVAIGRLPELGYQLVEKAKNLPEAPPEVAPSPAVTVVGSLAEWLSALEEVGFDERPFLDIEAFLDDLVPSIKKSIIDFVRYIVSQQQADFFTNPFSYSEFTMFMLPQETYLNDSQAFRLARLGQKLGLWDTEVDPRSRELWVGSPDGELLMALLADRAVDAAYNKKLNEIRNQKPEPPLAARLAKIELPSGPVREFLEFAKSKGADIVVTGGGVRDSVLGGVPNDIDFTVKLRLPDSVKEKILSEIQDGRSARQINDQYGLSRLAREQMGEAAKRMGLSVRKISEQLVNFGQGGESWRGHKIEFTWSSFVVGPYLLSVSTDPIFTIDYLAVDGDGYLYQNPRSDGWDDLHRGVVKRFASDLGLSPRALIRALRYKHQYGFRISQDIEEVGQRVWVGRALTAQQGVMVNKIFFLKDFLIRRSWRDAMYPVNFWWTMREFQLLLRNLFGYSSKMRALSIKKDLRKALELAEDPTALVKDLIEFKVSHRLEALGVQMSMLGLEDDFIRLARSAGIEMGLFFSSGARLHMSRRRSAVALPTGEGYELATARLREDIALILKNEKRKRFVAYEVWEAVVRRLGEIAFDDFLAVDNSGYAWDVYQISQSGQPIDPFVYAGSVRIEPIFNRRDDGAELVWKVGASIQNEYQGRGIYSRFLSMLEAISPNTVRVVIESEPINPVTLGQLVGSVERMGLAIPENVRVLSRQWASVDFKENPVHSSFTPEKNSLLGDQLVVRDFLVKVIREVPGVRERLNEEALPGSKLGAVRRKAGLGKTSIEIDADRLVFRNVLHEREMASAGSRLSEFTFSQSETEGVVTVAAQKKGQEVGFARFRINGDEATFHVVPTESNIRVDKEIRDEYRGVGSVLVARCLEIAKSKGALFVTVKAAHPDLARFYEGLGFKVDKSYKLEDEVMWTDWVFNLRTQPIPSAQIHRREEAAARLANTARPMDFAREIQRAVSKPDFPDNFELMLFGSYARGESRPASDVDVIVFKEHEAFVPALIRSLQRYTSARGKNIHVVIKDSFEQVVEEKTKGFFDKDEVLIRINASGAEFVKLQPASVGDAEKIKTASIPSGARLVEEIKIDQVPDFEKLDNYSVSVKKTDMEGGVTRLEADLKKNGETVSTNIELYVYPRYKTIFIANFFPNFPEPQNEEIKKRRGASLLRHLLLRNEFEGYQVIAKASPAFQKSFSSLKSFNPWGASIKPMVNSDKFYEARFAAEGLLRLDYRSPRGQLSSEEQMEARKLKRQWDEATIYGVVPKMSMDNHFKLLMVQAAAAMGGRVVELNHAPIASGARLIRPVFTVESDRAVTLSVGEGSKMLISRSALAASRKRSLERTQALSQSTSQSRQALKKSEGGAAQVVDVVAEDFFGVYSVQVGEMLQKAKARFKRENIYLRFINPDLSLNEKYSHLSDSAPSDSGPSIILASEESLAKMSLPAGRGLMLIDRSKEGVIAALPAIETAADLKRHGASQQVRDRMRWLAGNDSDLTDKIAGLLQVVPDDFNDPDRRKSYIQFYYLPWKVKTLPIDLNQVLSYIQMGARMAGVAA